MFKIIPIILLIAIVIWLIVTNIRIVPQANAYVVERLGWVRISFKVSAPFMSGII